MSYLNVDVYGNLSTFGAREFGLAGELLTAYSELDVPTDFLEEHVQLAFNPNSGFVFLTNSEYQALMLDKGKLKIWHSTPYSGLEGFLETLLEEWENENIVHVEDMEYISERIDYSEDPNLVEIQGNLLYSFFFTSGYSDDVKCQFLKTITGFEWVKTQYKHLEDWQAIEDLILSPNPNLALTLLTTLIK